MRPNPGAPMSRRLLILGLLALAPLGGCDLHDGEPETPAADIGAVTDSIPDTGSAAAGAGATP